MNFHLCRIGPGKTGRKSSYDATGRNADSWKIEPGETRVLADVEGPGLITHVWMTQRRHYREVLLRFTWDDAPSPSILVPLGDFFCLGHGIVKSFQSALFSASTNYDNRFNQGCALNCYAPMPFRKRALVELVNESNEFHQQYFHVDYETFDDEEQLRARLGLGDGEALGYFHAEFRRQNPFGGWGDEVGINSPESDVANLGRTAWENNYVILETRGRGHYVGCNTSITNLHGGWWGEGDEMVWVDGYKWPPDLHGTGSEDYFNQAWGMQPNAFLRSGSSIYEHETGGYQTSYVFHLENPVRFQREIKVTIEHGHANHLRNEVSSVAYWYAEVPTPVLAPPPVLQRLPVLKRPDGSWYNPPERQITTHVVVPNEEMRRAIRRWRGRDFEYHVAVRGPLSSDPASVGRLVFKLRFSPENPTAYDVALDELLEWFVGKRVRVHVGDLATTALREGTLVSEGEGKLVLEGPGGETTPLAEIFAPFVDAGETVELDAFLALNEEDEPIPDLYDVFIWRGDQRGDDA
ncbi:MAG: hypothetical protein Kow0069_09080 [Promethearchaeota archaeon]